MVYLTRSRKRIQELQNCGVQVGIDFGDIRELKNNAKNLKPSSCKENVEMHKFGDQPRSAFRFFMEEFVKTREDENEINVDRKGVELWKNMLASERSCYIKQAEKINSVYFNALRKEENDMIWVDDEAESESAVVEASCMGENQISQDNVEALQLNCTQMESSQVTLTIVIRIVGVLLWLGFCFFM